MDLAEADPKRASAELNTLPRMADRAEREGLKIDPIALIPTKTANCRLCARVVAEYLREEGYAVWETEPRQGWWTRGVLVGSKRPARAARGRRRHGHPRRNPKTPPNTGDPVRPRKTPLREGSTSHKPAFTRP